MRATRTRTAIKDGSSTTTTISLQKRTTRPQPGKDFLQPILCKIASLQRVHVQPKEADSHQGKSANCVKINTIVLNCRVSNELISIGAAYRSGFLNHEAAAELISGTGIDGHIYI